MTVDPGPQPINIEKRPQSPSALVWIMTVAWALLFAARLISQFYPASEPLPDKPRKVQVNPVVYGVAGKLMSIRDYLRGQPSLPMMGGDSARLAQENAAKMLAETGAQDIDTQVRLAIIEAEGGNIKLVESLPTPSQMEWQEVVKNVRYAYLGDKHPGPLASASNGLLGGGWYTDILDYRMALADQYGTAFPDAEARQESPPGEAVAQLQKKLDDGSYSTIFGMLIIGCILLVNLVMGFVLLILFMIFQKRLHWADEHPKWRWQTGWMVFLVFEFIQLGGGLVFYHVYSKTLGTLFLAQAFIYGATLLFVFRMLQMENIPPRAIGLHAQNLGRNILMGIGGYQVALVLLVVTALALSNALQGRNVSENPVFGFFDEGRQSILAVIGLGLLVCIVGPIFEEILFRGVLLTSFQKILSPGVALLATSALFALAHADLPGLMPIFVLALVMGTLKQRTGSLVPSCVMHCFQNSMTFFFTMFLLS